MCVYIRCVWQRTEVEGVDQRRLLAVAVCLCFGVPIRCVEDALCNVGTTHESASVYIYSVICSWLYLLIYKYVDQHLLRLDVNDFEGTHLQLFVGRLVHRSVVGVPQRRRGVTGNP
jgi:hypothetical protein